MNQEFEQHIKAVINIYKKTIRLSVIMVLTAVIVLFMTIYYHLDLMELMIPLLIFLLIVYLFVGTMAILGIKKFKWLLSHYIDEEEKCHQFLKMRYEGINQMKQNSKIKDKPIFIHICQAFEALNNSVE